jgi:four helix bundle protein
MPAEKYPNLFDHEDLEVYQLAVELIGWVYQIADHLDGYHRHARDQLLRASQSVTQNIAEGNGKRSKRDRARFFEIARGSALECAAILDALTAGKAILPPVCFEQKQKLARVVGMLTKLVAFCQKSG